MLSTTTPEIITSLFENLIAPMVVGFASYAILRFRDFWKAKQKSYSIFISTEKNERLQELLTEIRVTFGANRAYLSMFHNGDKYIDGSEVLKKSRTNECVDASTNFQAQNFQNVKISLIPEEMTLVKDPGPSFTLVNSLKDCKFKRLLISGGVRAIARCPIRNVDSIIGFVGLDFIKTEESPANIDDLVKYAGIIEQVLSSFRS